MLQSCACLLSPDPWVPWRTLYPGDPETLPLRRTPCRRIGWKSEPSPSLLEPASALPWGFESPSMHGEDLRNQSDRLMSAPTAGESGSQFCVCPRIPEAKWSHGYRIIQPVALRDARTHTQGAHDGGKAVLSNPHTVEQKRVL